MSGPEVSGDRNQVSPCHTNPRWPPGGAGISWDRITFRQARRGAAAGGGAGTCSPGGANGNSTSRTGCTRPARRLSRAAADNTPAHSARPAAPVGRNRPDAGTPQRGWPPATPRGGRRERRARANGLRRGVPVRGQANGSLRHRSNQFGHTAAASMSTTVAAAADPRPTPGWRGVRERERPAGSAPRRRGPPARRARRRGGADPDDEWEVGLSHRTAVPRQSPAAESRAGRGGICPGRASNN